MSRSIYTVTLSIILLTGLFSCQKVIQVHLNDSAPQYVVEGNVTDQPGPYTVKITRSVNFDQNNVFPGVDSAVVVIVDSNTLIADTLQQTASGVYLTHILTGIPGHTYKLSVKTGALSFTCSSTMPQPIAIDSLYTDAGLFNKDKKNAVITFHDPLGTGNYYHITERVNDSTATTIFVISDEIADGREITATLNRSLDINTGDSINVTLECIDHGAYEYLYTLAQTIRQNSATPANPQSNITGGALGYFSAHTTRSKGIIAP